eukprot:SM008481S23431  [mRNA]  locus=s8481:435:626:+ [translate_table: standard]
MVLWRSWHRQRLRSAQCALASCACWRRASGRSAACCQTWRSGARQCSPTCSCATPSGATAQPAA